MKALQLNSSPARWVFCKAAGVLWPAVRWSRASNLRLAEVAEPALPGPDWVRLRTVLGGICGTDLSMVAHQTHPATIVRPFTSFPMVLGHENVAIVDAVGESVSDWKVGDRVVVEPALSCVPRGIDPPCEQCVSGRFALCERFLGDGNLPAGTMIGLNNRTAGSWAPHFVAHRSQLHRVPDALPDEQAVLVDPVACSLHAVMRHRPETGQRVIVMGGGIIGLGVVMALRAIGFGGEVYCVARGEFRRKLLESAGASGIIPSRRGESREELFASAARVLGARRVASAFGNQTLIGGVDVAYDCVGTGRSLSDAMKLCRARGTVVAVGTSQITLVDTTALWFQELTVVGANGRQMETAGGEARHTYEWVMDWAVKGKLRLDGLLTHEFALRDYRRAFSTLLGRSRGSVVKAAFRHGA